MKRLYLVLLSGTLISAPAEVSFKDGSFYVDNKPVQRCLLNAMLKNIKSEEQLAHFIEQNGRVDVVQYGEHEYGLNGNGSLNGGGPILAWGVWGVCKGAMFVCPFIAKKMAKKHAKRHNREHMAWDATSLASDSIRSLDGFNNQVCVERGTSFIYDEAERRGYIATGAGDNAPMATVMMVGPQGMRTASSAIDRLRDVLMALPTP